MVIKDCGKVGVSCTHGYKKLWKGRSELVPMHGDLALCRGLCNTQKLAWLLFLES